MLRRPLPFITFSLVFILFSQSESTAQKSTPKEKDLSSPAYLKTVAKDHSKTKWKAKTVTSDESDYSAAALYLLNLKTNKYIVVKFSQTHPDYNKLTDLVPGEVIEFVPTSEDQDPEWRTTGSGNFEYTRYLRLKPKKD